VSPAAGDHPEFESSVERVTSLGRRLSFSSLRLSAVTPKAARLLGEGGLRGVAVAPEGGTEAMRARMNKNLPETEILEGARALGEAGLRNLKLYFMYGLPGETDGDLAQAAELAARVRKAVSGKGAGPRVAASFAAFVPKPHTPFEGEPLLDEREIQRRGAVLKRLLPPGKGIELRLDSPRSAVVQGIIARGGPEASALVRALLATGGRQGPALRLAAVPPDSWLFRPLAPGAPRPWRVVEAPPGQAYLDAEARKALEGAETPPCPPGLGCGRCGACGP
jgi:hypothetical protein